MLEIYRKKLQDGYRIEQGPLQLCGGFLGSKGTKADKNVVKWLVSLYSGFMYALIITDFLNV